MNVTAEECGNATNQSAEPVACSVPSLRSLKYREISNLERRGVASSITNVEDMLPNTESPPGEWRIPRALVNFWLDAALMLNFVVLSVTAVIVQFVFPPGVSAKGWRLWTFDYGQWCGFQFFLLSLLGVGVVVHIMLHWSWVCGIVARRILGESRVPDSGLQTLYGVALLIILLLGGAVVTGAAMITIRMPPQ